MMTQRNVSPLYIINAGLFLALAVALIVAIYQYKIKVETITMSDNRHLTTEWHLLQELKARTDRELREKDLEISRLRLEYENLATDDFSAAMLRELEAELARAEKEREAILSQRLLATSPVSAGTRGAKESTATAGNRAQEMTAIGPATGLATKPDDPVFTGDGTTALSRLLGERITTLEAQSAAYRLRAETAEKKLAQAETRLATQSASVKAETNAATDADAGSGEVDMLMTLIEQRKDNLRTEASPSLEDLKTRSLLRAIISTPAIKAEYPGLLEAMDRSFAAYGRQEWVAGQKNAYAFMLESLETLRAE
jgi:hypothetical protein